MQLSLFLLLLMGQCSFFMCHLHEYHFVKEKKTWTEAQQYCREHHTDLATVSNMTDMERLRDSAQNQDGAWIGLYSDPERNERGMWHWQWSLPGLEFNDRESGWHEGEPNDYLSTNEKCVLMNNHIWWDAGCSYSEKFMCYDERKQSNKTFHLIEDEMSWPQAQSYCREHHTDLVSGDQQLEDDEFNDEYRSNEVVWIGLFRDSWRWSDGSNHSFRYWDLELFRDEDSSKKCAVTLLDGKWSSNKCNKTKPFFCYDEPTTKKGTTAAPSSSTVTEDTTQEPTTKKGTTAGPSSSTVTEDKTQVSMADKMILIKENMSWDDALKYCRMNHCDLVSITNPDEQRWVQEKAKKANSPYVWLGLRYTCTLGFWFWVNEEMVTYKNWGADVPADDCDMSGAMDRGGEHKWFKKNDNEKFNFICSTC